MHRLATSSLGILPLWFVMACAPIDLTVGDENASGGQGATGAAKGSDTSAGGEMMSDALPSEGDAGTPTDEPEPKPEPTPVDPFVCDDGVEIDKSLRCNGKAECPDGSDELGCPSEPFVCADGSKIAPSLVCNGKDECADGSDELGCTTDPAEECATDSGIEMAPPFDPVQGCWLPQIAIGCFKLIPPSLSVPTNWGVTTCARRESDDVLFLVPSPQLATEWDDCTPDELAAIEHAQLCP
jgi:hypothetical protein